MLIFLETVVESLGLERKVYDFVGDDGSVVWALILVGLENEWMEKGLPLVAR